MSHHYTTGFGRESRRTSINLHHSCLPPQTNHVYAVAVARIYHSQFSSKPDDWAYSGLRGLLIFGQDKDDGGEHWFRLIDDISDRVIWMIRLPSGFVYEQDKPFFYTFSGLSRKFGFLFGDDEEAARFSQQVTLRTAPRSPPLSSKPTRKAKRSPSSKHGQLSPALVASPITNSFAHVSHVGMNTASGTIEHSRDLSPEWSRVLADFTNQREDTSYDSQPETGMYSKSSTHIAPPAPKLGKKPSLSIWRMRRIRSTQQAA